ncbi:MAG TPA: pitrilysin family protein [Candidatus Paceibacterota bacterium]
MNYHKKILKNGMRIITVPMADNPAVTVLVMVEAGSKYETAEISGLSHFLEHMCFKGTRTRPKAINISRELDSIGAQYNAFTSQEFTGYYAKAGPRHLNTILDVVSDMYVNPLFDEKEIEKEKGVIVEEINMYEDTPHKHVQDLFMELLYGDQPAGWNIAGRKETVKAMKREFFEDYRRKHYVSGATTVVIAGKFNEETIYDDIEKKFIGIHEGKKHDKTKVIEKQKEPRIKVQHKKTDQAHLVIGVRSCDIWSASVPILRVLSAVLGGGMSSRLFQKLRDEMGVGYYVNAGNDIYTDHGYFEISTGVDKERVTEVIKAILNECQKLTEDEVPPDELKKAKDYIIGTMFLGLETSDAVAEFFGYQEILKRSVITPSELAKIINMVSAEEIKDMAQQIFQNKNLNMALVGGFKNNKEFEPIFHF